MPYEAWHSKKSVVHHLHTFGCMAFMKVTHPHLTKLKDRGKKGVFIGYEAGTKGYWIFDPVEGWVHDQGRGLRREHVLELGHRQRRAELGAVHGGVHLHRARGRRSTASSTSKSCTGLDTTSG
jgi:hypothetical protein